MHDGVCVCVRDGVCVCVCDGVCMVFQIPALMDEESCDEEEDERKVGHLVKLLQIMEAVNLATSVAEAVVEARKRRWFRTL